MLDHLAELGLDTLDAILMTHHHRDQGQGLPRAVAAGIPIFVPPVEQDLFSRVDEMWSARALYNDYNLRQDRFSLLDPVPVAGTVPEYRTARFGGVEVKTIPTPGHTMGSVTLPRRPRRQPRSRSPATSSTRPARCGRSRRPSGRTPRARARR